MTTTQNTMKADNSQPAALTGDDYREIADLLATVAYILDRHAYDRLNEVFSTDVDFNNPGRLVAHGLPNVIAAFKAITQPAVSHHITNVIITPIDHASASCLSKAFTLRESGVTSAEYTDAVRRTTIGWRIYSRSIRPLG